MNTLDRYLASTFFKNFLTSLVLLSVLFYFPSLLDDILENAYPKGQIFYHSILGIPEIIRQMIPSATLMGTILTLSGFSRTSELIAYYSVGCGLKRMTAVLLSMVFMVCCLSLIIEDRVLPPLYRKRQLYFYREMKKKSDFYLDIKQQKIWYRSKNLIYNIKNFDSKTNKIMGMTVYTFDQDFNLVQVIDAEGAKYDKGGWTLLNGTVTLFSEKSEFPLTEKFKEKSLVIAEKPLDFQEIEKEAVGLRFKELLKYIRKISAAGTDTRIYWVNFHSRLSLSFIPLMMCLVGVPFSVRGRREGGIALDLVHCMGVIFIYWMANSVFIALATSGRLPAAVGAWMPTLLFGVLGAVLLSLKIRR